MSIGQMVKLDPVNFSCIIPKESNLIIFNLEWKDSNTVLTIRIFLSEILLLKVHGFYGRYKNLLVNYNKLPLKINKKCSCTSDKKNRSELCN